VTLEEIARLAGVSRSTVSRVVNGDRRVSDAARARVQDVIRDYNYHPNAAARRVRPTPVMASTTR
jgi:LacI family transcriptional regulator